MLDLDKLKKLIASDIRSNHVSNPDQLNDIVNKYLSPDFTSDKDVQIIINELRTIKPFNTQSYEMVETFTRSKIRDTLMMHAYEIYQHVDDTDDKFHFVEDANDDGTIGYGYDSLDDEIYDEKGFGYDDSENDE